MDEEATNDGNLLEDILHLVSPCCPMLVSKSYLLHSWNAIEEENSKDASGSAESTCEAAAT